MEEHLEHDFSDLQPELSDEAKVQLSNVAEEFEAFVKAGETTAAQTLVEEIAGPQMRNAAFRYMAALRMRKAAAAKGLRIGV